MHTIDQRRIGEFLSDVASRTPAPGGGAAAAVTAGTAAGLVAMAARFSTGELAELAERADKLRVEVVPLADADAEVYTEVLAAYRLARSIPDRQQRITDALRAAARVPLRIAEIGADLAQLAARLVEEGNPNLKGDAQGAALLAEGATRTAASLVRINAELGGLGYAWFSAAEECTRVAMGASRATVRCCR
ncbi:formiminotetrahydrofolate cyclodeaminase [Tamaricihabitans halophyticus]|uniref:Formiminotetrahydrofolate cyclodeaminase n=1 Tax=Tamaricihabitans halophyticus TaxID=1262583 RepID=A0A4R2Q5Y1_9PSEU|nr:cyclodeaminase/cyclohydrolase family protein [Tamaricihabitans halophyticus]TCP43899.1 formiminotetrahydrofolate cyclodeaminase [Tamaricihabitans halophyticus]